LNVGYVAEQKPPVQRYQHIVSACLQATQLLEFMYRIVAAMAGLTNGAFSAQNIFSDRHLTSHVSLSMSPLSTFQTSANALTLLTYQQTLFIQSSYKFWSRMLMTAVQDAHFGSALIVAIRKKLPVPLEKVPWGPIKRFPVTRATLSLGIAWSLFAFIGASIHRTPLT
jgi:hypothetical protein